MKKVILTVILCLATIGITQARRTRITMHIPTSSYKNKKHGYICHAPSFRTSTLIAEMDDNNISISSIQAGSSISLILYDEFGNIIYESVFNTPSSCLTIEIPPEIIEEANTIKITLNGADYIGEIY